MFTVCPVAGKYSALSFGHVPVKAACSCLTSLLLLVDALPTKRKALQQCYTLQKPADNTIKAEVAYFKTHAGTELQFNPTVVASRGLFASQFAVAATWYHTVLRILPY